MKKQPFLSEMFLILVMLLNLFQGWLGFALPNCQMEQAVFSSRLQGQTLQACPHTSETTCCDHHFTSSLSDKKISSDQHLDCLHCLSLHLQTSMMLFGLIGFIISFVLYRNRFRFPAVLFCSHIPERLHRPPHYLFSLN